MSDQKVEPVAVTVQDAQTSNPSTVTNSKSADEKPADPSLVAVRTETLQAVVVHQETVIAELERKVEKTRSKVERFEDSPHLIPQHPMPILHPHNPAATMAAASATPSAVHPRSTSALPTTPPLCPASQPLPSPNPGVAAAVAAATAAHPPASGALLAQYPFMFPPPDHATMAALMRGVMPPLLPTSQTHPQPPPSAHPPQNSNCPDDNEKKQSRYWTQDEHQRFLAAVRAYGPKNYGQISEYVGTRSAKQVRTHAQKYQKKLERDEAREARRRGEHGVNGHSVGAAAAAAVAAAARAAIHGNVPGAIASHPIHTNPIPPSGRAGQTSSSSRKNFSNYEQHGEREPAARSVDGSSSTNDVSKARRIETDSNSVCEGESSHAGAAAAAAAAVAAEAANLGGGIISQRERSPLMVQIPSSKENTDKSHSGTGDVDETGKTVKSSSTVDVDRTTDASKETSTGLQEKLATNCSSGGDSAIRTATPATAEAEKPTSLRTDNGSENNSKDLKQNDSEGITIRGGKDGSHEAGPIQNNSETHTTGGERTTEPKLTLNRDSDGDLVNTGDAAGLQYQSDGQAKCGGLRAEVDGVDKQEQIVRSCESHREDRASLELERGNKEGVEKSGGKNEDASDQMEERDMAVNRKGMDRGEAKCEDTSQGSIGKGSGDRSSDKSTETGQREQVIPENGGGEREAIVDTVSGADGSQKEENECGMKMAGSDEDGKQLETGDGHDVTAKGERELGKCFVGKENEASVESRKRPREDGNGTTGVDGKRAKVDKE